MKIYMINVTLQVGMAAASVELAFTDHAEATGVFDWIVRDKEKQSRTVEQWSAKGRRAAFCGADVACVTLSEMQVQGAPVFQ